MLHLVRTCGTTQHELQCECNVTPILDGTFWNLPHADCRSIQQNQYKKKSSAPLKIAIHATSTTSRLQNAKKKKQEFSSLVCRKASDKFLHGARATPVMRSKVTGREPNLCKSTRKTSMVPKKSQEKQLPWLPKCRFYRVSSLREASVTTV